MARETNVTHQPVTERAPSRLGPAEGLLAHPDLPRIFQWVVLAAGVVFVLYVAALPLRPGASLAFWFTLMKLMILAQSLNIIAGYTGYVDFGHVAFFGLGTYVAGIGLAKLGLPVPVPLWVVLGPVLVALIAGLVGLPLLRLRGSYFAIAMVAFNESTRLVVLNLPRSLAGGAFGIPMPSIYDPNVAFYAMVALFVAITAFTVWLATSRFGVALKAIRDDEDAAAVMGIRTTRYKVTAFAVAAYFAGVAGAVDYWFTAYTSNELVFNTAMTVEMVAGMMLGGAGTVVGPLLGAGILYWVRDLLWVNYPFIYLVIFGGVIITVVLFVPRGIIGLLEDRVPALRARIR